MDKKTRLIIQKQCIENRLTIYDIKYRLKNAPHFFDHDTLKFFKQTMKSFHVNKTDTLGIYYVWAEGFYHTTERYFNAFDNMFYGSYEKAAEGV
jgi:hypothetical protein